MSATTIVILFILVSGLYAFLYFAKANNSKAKVLKTFNVGNQQSNELQFLKEILTDRFPYIQEDINGASVDAFTQGKVHVSVGQAAGKLAKAQAKMAMKKMLGATGTYSGEQPHFSFFVISGTDLHFLKYQTGEDLKHYVFNKEQVISASVEMIDRSQIKKAALGDYAEYLLTIENDRGQHKLVIQEHFTEMGINSMGLSQKFQKEVVRFDVVANHFVKKFQEIYPNKTLS